MSEQELAIAFQLAVEKLTAALEKINTERGCDGNSPLCQLRFQRLEETAARNVAAIRGDDTQPGIIGLIQVLTNCIENVESSHDELQKTLTGLVIAVILTLIGTVLNLVLR